MVQRATRESVAYDYARFDNRRIVRQAVEASRKPEVLPKRKKRSRAISFTHVLSYLAVLFVSGVIVYNYMQVTMLADQGSRLEAQITKLKSEETGMHAEQEKLYNLNYIEKYAKEKLNMVKADESQISYVEMSKPDQVKILKDGKDGASGYFSGFIKTFNVVLEYLD